MSFLSNIVKIDNNKSLMNPIALIVVVITSNYITKTAVNVDYIIVYYILYIYIYQRKR